MTSTNPPASPWLDGVTSTGVIPASSNPNPPHSEEDPEADRRSSSSDSESGSSTSSAMGDSSEDDRAEAVVADLTTREEDKVPLSATFVRVLALLCACSLSIGSHYGAYFLGPLKSRLSRDIGTSNTEFSLLIAAYNLNNTWTPLVGGVMAARISLALGLVAGKGTSFLSAYTSYPLSQKYGPHAPFVVSTTLAAVSFGFNIVYLMSANWFTRGARVAPEAADVHRRLSRSESFFSPRGRQSLSAQGLLSSELTESPVVLTRGGERMTEREALEKVAAKRNVKFEDLTKMGDVFWLYIGVNALCGVIWSPFTHLAANIIEKRYSLTELEASNRASMLLAGSIILYPLCGYLTDRLKKGPIVHHLFVLSSVLTLFCYLWLALPPTWTASPNPAIFAFATGHGFSTLLLVIIVPHLVPLPYVSTALGAHKSIESAGSTISKILAGLLLDTKSSKKSAPAEPDLTMLPSVSISSPTPTTVSPPIDNARAIQWLLNWWLFINVLQLLGTIILWKMDVKRKRLHNRGESGSRGFDGYSPLPTEDAPRRRSESRGATEPRGLLDPDVVGKNPWADEPSQPQIEVGNSQRKYRTWTSPAAQRPLLQNTASPVSPKTNVPLPQSPPRRYPSYTDPSSDPPQEPTSPRSSRVAYLLPPAADGSVGRRSPISRRRRSWSVGSGGASSMHHGVMKNERRRGKWFMAMSGLLVLITWALFWGTALSKIKQKNSTSGSE
ncbi:hypothetical protein FRC02_009516 [Tulasnella sp. 418]|nr:hypothetical protein FRC02_009516 [Tulasnella sp. 418]